MGRALSALHEPVTGKISRKLETGSAHASGEAQKRHCKEFCEGFLNPRSQAAVVVE